MGILVLNAYGKYVPSRRGIEGGLIALGVGLLLLSLAADQPFLRAERVRSRCCRRYVARDRRRAGVLRRIAYGFVAIPAQTQLQEELPEDVRGRVFGVLNMLVSIASFLPIIIVGPISDLGRDDGRDPRRWHFDPHRRHRLGRAARTAAARGVETVADPHAVDPIAAALGADRPTWYEVERGEGSARNGPETPAPESAGTLRDRD